MYTTQYDSYVQNKQTIDINRYPGRHDQHSPVVGKRAHELRGLSAKIKEAPILLELEQKLYYEQDTTRYRKLIPYTHQELGNALAKEIFSKTIDPYRPFGINEDNAVQWVVYSEEGSHVIYINQAAPKYTQTTLEIKNIPHLAAFVQKSPYVSAETLQVGLSVYPKDDKYSPNYLDAAHELRHVEEWDILERNADREGRELLPTLQDIIYGDEIYKKIFGIDLREEVDHDGKTFTLGTQVISIGKLANFYRELTSIKGSLYEAVVSEESLAFLCCRDELSQKVHPPGHK